VSPSLPPAPSCTDGILNQDEIKIDCGGKCKACPFTQTCSPPCLSKEKCVTSEFSDAYCEIPTRTPPTNPCAQSDPTVFSKLQAAEQKACAGAIWTEGSTKWMTDPLSVINSVPVNCCPALEAYVGFINSCCSQASPTLMNTAYFTDKYTQLCYFKGTIVVNPTSSPAGDTPSSTTQPAPTAPVGTTWATRTWPSCNSLKSDCQTYCVTKYGAVAVNQCWGGPDYYTECVCGSSASQVVVLPGGRNGKITGGRRLADPVPVCGKLTNFEKLVTATDIAIMFGNSRNSFILQIYLEFPLIVFIKKSR
jgi:hypothetical protein